MGAHTWTFIRVDKLTPSQVKGCIEYAIWSNKYNTYGDYSKLTEERYVKDWIDFHKKDYDYFVNECGVPPEKMTDAYLTKEIKLRMKIWYFRQECYHKCLDGTMSFEDMLKKTHQLKTRLDDFYIIEHKGNYYVHIRHEIFRNYEYCDEEFDTVESLIEHCRNCKGNQFLDLTEKNMNYQEWNDELENKVKEYYQNIGDGNFVVHYG